MTCTECPYYECALRSPMGGCPDSNGRPDPVGIITTPHLGHGPWEQGYQPSGIRKTNELFDRIVANIQEEMMERVKKEMSCKWYRGGDCAKGLPGTPYSLVGCVAWSEMTEDDEIQIQREYRLASAALALVDAVERYTMGKCLRSELLNTTKKMKDLLK